MKSIRWFKTHKEGWTVFCFIAFLLSTAQTFAVTADGIITTVNSATAFDVGTLHVLLNAQTQCETQPTPQLITMGYSILGPLAPYSVTIEAPYSTKKLGLLSKQLKTISMPCVSEHFMIGSRVHLVGILQGNKGNFVATGVTLVEPPKPTLKDGALLEEKPYIHHEAEVWHGNLWVNGYPTTITPQTILKPRNISFSSSFLMPNTRVTYRSILSTNQNLVAKQLHFLPNRIYPTEKKFLREFTPKIEVPNYGNHIPGSIQYKHGDAIKILPNEKLQEYVSKLGMEVVPQYQKNLEANDPTKIDFKFYVVYPFIHTGKSYLMEINGGISGKFGNLIFASHLVLNTPKPDSLVEDIIAMPEGTIIIPDVVLSRLNNEGQLAALLSYAVTSIIQKQAYYAWSLGPQNTSFLSNSFSFGNLCKLLAYPQIEQELRLGIRQMYLAGYDIREAPFAWAVAQGKPVNNPVIDSKHPDKEIPWYAAYAFNYISHYYSDVDYSKLKRGEREYQQFLQELYKADPSLPHPKEAGSATAAAATK